MRTRIIPIVKRTDLYLTMGNKENGHDTFKMLVREHTIILMVLDAAGHEARSIRKTGAIQGDVIGDMVDFFRTFARRTHHPKEELHLFQLMHERGFPYESGPLAVMRHEHEQGRSLVSEIERLIPKAEERDGSRWIASRPSSGIRPPCFVHISEKRTMCFYPIADNVLSHNGIKEIERLFCDIENDEAKKGIHERYHDLALKISERSTGD